jgi:hypothetical protein
MAAAEGAEVPEFQHVPGLPEVLAEVSGRLDREMTDGELAVFKAVIELIVVPLVRQWADLGGWVEKARRATVRDLEAMLDDLGL